MDSLILVFLTVFVIFIAKFLYRKVYVPTVYWKSRGLPHLTTYPIIGSFPQVFLQREHFFDLVVRLYNEHKDKKILGATSVGINLIIVRDIELIQEITIKQFDHFVNHSVAFVDPVLDPLFYKNLFMLKGQDWHYMRKALTPAFTGSKMRGIYQHILKCGDQLTNYLNEQVQNTESVLEMELKATFTKFTNDLIATTAFGLEMNSFRNPNSEFYQMANAATKFTSFRLLAVALFPWLMKLIGEGVIPRKAQNYFAEVIMDTVKQREEKGIKRMDMLDLMIEAKKISIEQAKTDETVKVLTDFDIAAQAFLFFFAGYEVTANTMSFACFELAIEPECQKKLHDEIDQVLASGNGSVTYEQINEMKYLDAVVTETLRKWPGGGGFLDRKCTKDFFVKDAFGPGNDYTIKKDDNLHLYIGGVQRDPQFYPNPDKFDPERFYDQKPGAEIYYPFGSGPRHCIGIRFAQLEVKTAVFSIFKDFELVPTKGTTVPIILKKSTSLVVPENGFVVGLKKRQKISK